MMKSNLKTAIKIALLSGAAMMATNATAYDKELLDILLSNGSINQVQYDGLIGKVEKEDEVMKKMAWAGKIKIKGDLRLRHETRSDSGAILGSAAGPLEGEMKTFDKDRERYRMRLGIYADVTENVQAGIRFASGDKFTPTSTNETLRDHFAQDDLWIDLAYINWQPLEGLELIGGKVKQPWEKISGGLVWDGDVNPEGAVLRYSHKLGGAELIGSAGHYILNDSGGKSFREDQTITHGQFASKFEVAGAKALLGVSIYDYNQGRDKNGGILALIYGGGNDSTKYSLKELFGSVSLKAPIPLKVYGQYVKNSDADGPHSGENTAWLLGVGTKFGKWKFSYDYRDTELNAVYGVLNDSDFADGLTGSKGSRLKASYKISKNFEVATAYFDAKVRRDSTNTDYTNNFDMDTWQLDLKAKF
ncbi:MAG: hypothetical protein DRQ61_07055 [Gammaproteobacteria bacterium]|nr:MAG: hypothetical protein DRQ56_01820 [Gammaproteobacteria bacterium]RLA22164.1 MAG: hypothetical protein DRQ61_07055 [Gammaproteobacteria bacterium]